MTESSAEGAELQVDRLYELHAASVLAFAIRRAPDVASAEDVMAETFAIAWRRREVLPEQELPWLYSIALNVLSNQRRSRGRRFRLLGKIQQEVVPFGRDPAEMVEGRDAIRAAFQALSEGQREVIRLAFWEDLSPDEAAAVLGCSPGAYRVRLHRARAALAKHLDASEHLAADAQELGRSMTDPNSQEAR